MKILSKFPYRGGRTPRQYLFTENVNGYEEKTVATFSSKTRKNMLPYSCYETAKYAYPARLINQVQRRWYRLWLKSTTSFSITGRIKLRHTN